MPIGTDFAIDSTGNIRRAAGASSDIYTVLQLHEWLQDLADNAESTGNDLLDIYSPNPSRLDGPRDATNASRLNLLSEDLISFNIDATAARFFNFGSIKQDSGNVQYSGLKTIGTIAALSPIYVVQDNAKLTKFWSDGHIQILVQVRTAGSLIDSGNVTAFSRKFGQTYSHFDVNLASGGETSAALATASDPSTVLTEVQAAALSSKVSISIGDTTQDLGNGNGGKLYKGTITLSNGCTLQEAYQYLQYITREASTTTINSIPGWRYRKLNAAYTENASAPFGSFAGGTFFVAQGWFLTGVLTAEATRYQLIAHDGTLQVPPILATISVGNLVVGDNVTVGRVSAGSIIRDEYTPIAASSGATALTVVESIKSDTPSSGVIRIKNKRYSYSAFNAGTKTFTGLNPALTENIVTADDVFVPFIDKIAAATTESVSFVFAAPFTVRVDVRNGSGLTPIIPFKEPALAVTSSGATVNAARNSDV